MSMRRLMAQAAGGLVIAFGAGVSGTLHAQAQDAGQALITKVAASNLLEVRLGQAAQKQGENAAVKQFAQRMVVDHTSMQKQWMAAAKKNDLDFKATLTPQQLEQAYRLRDLSGSAFDRAYIDAMVQNHRENVSSFQAERNAGHPADIRQLIESALPALQEHLTSAQQVARQVGGDVATSGGTPTDTTTVTRPGQTTVGQPRQTTSTVAADSAFIREVEASNLAEIRLAEIADRKASDPQVKRFAQKMITDHAGLQRQWDSVALTSGFRSGGNLSQRHQEQITRVDRLSGTEFDRAFMSAMVVNHQENVQSLKTKGRYAQTSQVRQLVSRSLPPMEEHLSLAQQVASQVGANTPSTIADEPGQGPKGDVKRDNKFIRNTDADHFLEIRLARLADQKASNSEVKQFARRMEADHTSLQRQWTAMATNNGMKYKSGMGPRHRSKLTRLEKLSGREFDREYMTLVAQNHQDYLDYFRKEGRAANSAPVRELVNRDIPILEQHIRQAKQIGVRVGADTITSRVGRISATQQ